MFIKQIEVRNFKSFKHLKIDLNNLSILIGANASGKSNFISIFKFLRNIIHYNLNDAISIEGGVKYLRNINLGNSENLAFRITYDPHSKIARKPEKGLGLRLCEAAYEFEIRFNKRGKGFRINQDKLTVTYDFIELEDRGGGNLEEVKLLDQGQIVYSVVNSKLRFELNLPKSIPLSEGEINPLFTSRFEGSELPENTLLLGTPFFGLAHNLLVENLFEDIAIYDFDPKLSHKAVPVTGKAELEENASNLSIVLKNILSDREQKRRFLNITADLLPFARDFHVRKQTDKSLLFTLSETYSSSTYLPAFLLSDGTVNITALIIALYFEQKPMLVLEEPERTVHPFLISKVVELFAEVSSEKQIIVTTHNPEIVKHAQIEDILLMTRDREGFSTICRPGEREDVRIFLQNEIGIDDLYTKNLLGG